MHRLLVVCAISAALLVGGAGVASASPPAAPVSLAGTWDVQVVGSTCHPTCETIKFNTSNGTFAENDAHKYGDHGTYSLTGQTLKLLWTAGGDKKTTFAGTYASAKHSFVGTYVNPFNHKKYKGDLLHKT